MCVCVGGGGGGWRSHFNNSVVVMSVFIDIITILEFSNLFQVGV